MEYIVFNSWQSILDESKNRGVIREALELSAGSAVDVKDAVRVGGSVASGGRVRMPSRSSCEIIEVAMCGVFDLTPVVDQGGGFGLPSVDVMTDLHYAVELIGVNYIWFVVNKGVGMKLGALTETRMAGRYPLVYDSNEEGVLELLVKNFTIGIQAAFEMEKSAFEGIQEGLTVGARSIIRRFGLKARFEIEGELESLDKLIELGLLGYEYDSATDFYRYHWLRQGRRFCRSVMSQNGASLS